MTTEQMIADSTLIGTVKRANGEIEKIDLSKRYGTMTEVLFKKLAEGTKKAGAGTILDITQVRWETNINKLMRDYNNLHNEGGEGYIPEVEYFQNCEGFKSEKITKVFK